MLVLVADGARWIGSVRCCSNERPSGGSAGSARSVPGHVLGARAFSEQALDLLVTDPFELILQAHELQRPRGGPSTLTAKSTRRNRARDWIW